MFLKSGNRHESKKVSPLEKTKRATFHELIMIIYVLF